MAEPHVVAALKEESAELSGSIADLEKRICEHRADLLHVDAVLRLFAPEFEPTTILPRAVRRPNSWFKPGEPTSFHTNSVDLIEGCSRDQQNPADAVVRSRWPWDREADRTCGPNSRRRKR